jgi:hypothetical protein
MFQEHQQHQQHRPTWGRAKLARASYGLSAPQLARYADENLIRTSHIRRTGQTRGVRLYNFDDIERLILNGIESVSSVSQKPESKTNKRQPKPSN